MTRLKDLRWIIEMPQKEIVQDTYQKGMRKTIGSLNDSLLKTSVFFEIPFVTEI